MGATLLKLKNPRDEYCFNCRGRSVRRVQNGVFRYLECPDCGERTYEDCGLTWFVQRREVAAQLRTIHPGVDRSRRALKVPPRTRDACVLGFAFEWLLYFELSRRGRKPGIHKVMAKWSDQPAAVKLKSEAQDYLSRSRPTRQMKERLAFCIHRFVLSGKFVRESESHQDAVEMVDLLALVPLDRLIHRDVLVFHPSFLCPLHDGIIDGIPDLIAGDILLDIKTTNEPGLPEYYLNQIVGYLILARLEQSRNPEFPAINRLGIYMSRHGHLWERPVSLWTENPIFIDVERWFLKQATLPATNEIAFVRPNADPQYWGNAIPRDRL